MPTVLRAAAAAAGSGHRKIVSRRSVAVWMIAAEGILLARLAFAAIRTRRVPEWGYVPPSQRGAGAGAVEPAPFGVAVDAMFLVAALLCLAAGVTQSLRRCGLPGAIALPIGLLPLIVTATSHVVMASDMRSRASQFDAACFVSFIFGAPLALLALCLPAAPSKRPAGGPSK
ncbi:MAG: hypothetical protein AB7G11_04660 [Phycisphaerales bacterium]